MVCRFDGIIVLFSPFVNGKTKKRLKSYKPCCIIGLLMRRGQPRYPCLRIASPDWAAGAKRLRG
ncbi:hypothetical protein FAEPRAA2165_03462 [Faecalibacterium duncaniae]|uniref:Uncharacterized protein n=1 Tax=Faecalibacterium duncaniae (strain DSM 17677 / JCM 31915 / A2-165) TaxID=411483 RepID=C7HAV0_FAED2|nr:hypothetical protein FAEPRAA2165_03462 [Faecalibacterium duncaniae]